MAIYGYIRVSTAMQADNGESLDAQRRQVEGYAMQQGWDLDHVFVERGISGGKALADRPEGAKLLKGLRRGDAVVAPKLDRVFRSALDALQVCADFKRQGVSLHLLDLGGDVTGNGVAGLFMKIAAAFAEFERDRIAERQRDVKQDMKARGKYLGGYTPFGHRVEDGELVEVREEQAAIRTMLVMRAKKLSLRVIANEIRVRHHLTVSHVAVRRVLADHAARVAGA